MEMISDTIQKTFGLSNHMVGHFRPEQFVAGVELEVEANKNTDNPLLGIVEGWAVTKDGSLRNKGLEYISLPKTRDELVKDFKKIHSDVKFGEEKFSDRTSIHVHVNCMHLTQRQVKNLLLWYALYEPVFFSLVHHNRKHNIHCVPLEQTLVSQNYPRAVPVIQGKWSKYTAFNLLPLGDKGTVEFRHMDGHDDGKRFEQWLLILENLWKLAMSEDFTRKALEKPGMLDEQFMKIFKGTEAQQLRPYLNNLTASSLVDVKFAVI